LELKDGEKEDFCEWQESEEAIRSRQDTADMEVTVEDYAVVYADSEDGVDGTRSVHLRGVGEDIHGEMPNGKASTGGVGRLDENGHERVMSTENPMMLGLASQSAGGAAGAEGGAGAGAGARGGAAPPSKTLKKVPTVLNVKERAAVKL
jgi:hypothetical protein